MKNAILSLFLFFTAAQSFAQSGPGVTVMNPEQYQKLKVSGQLPQGPVIVRGDGSTVPMTLSPKISGPSPAQPSSVACQCMIPVDSTFQIVPMQGGTPPEYRNDDSYSPQINIPFNFCFYGVPQTVCYINNNGNISFGSPYGTFTANAFPDPSFVMIAPFWADVDTRNPASGLVYYKATPTYMIVRWQTVGYFASYADKLNDFQLIITDGTDPILPPGNNVSFCYGDMQWTTGDASSGVGGFGGSPATVGVNRGNGVDFIQLGQFDQPGTNYDGPFGANDQVSWLDNQTFYFDVCNNGSSNNLPPIVNSAQLCDTFEICVGDTVPIQASFLGPEQGQITSVTATATGGTLVNVSNTSGSPALYSAGFVASASGTGVITIVGTDNGTPPQSTTAVIVVNVVTQPTVSFSYLPTGPVPANTLITFTSNAPSATTWSWNFGDSSPASNLQNPTHTYTADGTYTVTLTITTASGCSNTFTTTVVIQTDVPLPPVEFPNVFTPNDDGTNDALVFKNLEFYPGSTLKLFNRWGNLIYQSADYHNDWNAKGVSDGVYYYILLIAGEEKAHTGYVQVLRGK